MRASENQLDEVSIIIPLLSCSLHVIYVGTVMLPFKGNSNKLFSNIKSRFSFHLSTECSSDHYYIYKYIYK